MKRLLEKIKIGRICNKLFSKVRLDECGYYVYSGDIKNAFVYRSKSGVIIIYKIIERLLGTRYNRDIHDLMNQKFGTGCLLHHIDYKGDLYHLTIEDYEEINRED